MRLTPFLTELFEHGHVRLGGDKLVVDQDDLLAAEPLLVERGRVVAADFPGSAPPLHREAALWAARQFYSVCHFVMFRELTAEEMQRHLASEPPTGEPASLHYSVDLTWRFLSDWDRLATTLAPQDPLRELVRGWGGQWPWSSVGMKRIEPQREGELLAHPGLRQAYIDRVIQRQDSARLANPQVRDLVHAALGRERSKEALWRGPLTVEPTKENRTII